MIYRFFCILSVLYVPVLAQTTKIFSLSGKYSVSGVDIHGNCYLVHQNTLVMYDNSGKLIFNYSDKSLGTISHVSVSSPLKISVLFAAKGLLVILDNTLTPVGAPISLRNMGIDDPVAACSADENGCWVYDAATGFFTLISWNGQKLQNSVDVRRIFPAAFFPDDMVMFSGNILAFSRTAGAIVLDNAANIQSVIDPPGNILSVGPNGLYLYENSKIVILNPLALSESFIPFHEDGIKYFSLNFPYLLVQFEKKISLYLLTSQ